MKETDSEQTFREIMSKSRLEVPFPDFEDNIMGLIEKKLSKKVSISRDIKLSWVFFILGSAFGIIVTILLPKIQQPVLGINPDKLTIPFLIIFAFLLLSQIDSLIDFYKRQKN
jgi:amino acid permease